jgi:DNA primase
MIPQSFLDDLRGRTVLSSLVSRRVKLAKAGREYKGLCPVHTEQSPSFFVNDDKGFAHCFGCGAHFDAVGWLVQVEGLPFHDAVRQLAEGAGMAMPERDAASAAREERRAGLRPCLDAAQAFLVDRLGETRAARDYLTARGIDDGTAAAFGIGYAPDRLWPRDLGFDFESCRDAGLVWEAEPHGRNGARFVDRIMVPVHDARGRLCGFGARVMPGYAGKAGKYLNSPDGPLFDKGAILFNLHRAAAAIHASGRAVIVEGYFDAIAMTQAGVGEVVAPMGTAITPRHLAALWRHCPVPVLMMDGDAAGRRAAVKACETALPFVGPGQSLSVALLPDGTDPDSLARADYGPMLIEAVIARAVPLAEFLFDAVAGTVLAQTAPEALAAIWARLAELGETIADPETRALYLTRWRRRYEDEIVPQLSGEAARAGAIDRPRRLIEEGGDFIPDDANDSERRLFQIVQQLLRLRAERTEIGGCIRDAMAMGKAIGFDGKALTAVVRDIEADAGTDAGGREAFEAQWALYRRTLGVRGPATEAMLPSAILMPPARRITAATKTARHRDALIDGGVM